uniref:HIT domain-containing protein n=2 Tax=Lotharella globosa TaxID=91324 RepID=A0A6V3J1T4_9EUKA|mmetsp:Transcript_3946/g.7572  ORF Transcript_3946/g.7572 Transcript_3946/m.7572 type:complete len:141 (+) Transcript_3946:83-505(+)
MSDIGSLFEKIVAGKIPSYKVYEDDLVFAFLDINPLAPGHTLVIPKKKYETLDKVPDETAAAIGKVLPRLARAIMKATECKDYNILQNNGTVAHQFVPHVHFHIIPRPNAKAGLGLSWNTTTDLKKEQAEALLKKITSGL